MRCRICDNQDGNTKWLAREMMLGLRTTFPYFECGGCGCVQIESIPEDLAPFYPPGYYSYSSPDRSSRSAPIRALKKARDSAIVLDQPPVGRALARLFPNRDLLPLRGLGLARTSRILDVGSGSGRVLHALADAGFTSLAGIDPHLPPEVVSSKRIRLARISLFECTGAYDLVMFHHSFEHMAEPERVLAQVATLLDPAGQCLLRLPTASSYAWRHYRTDWVQLDAPRHFFLHTIRSLELLTQNAGFAIVSLKSFSSGFQFWGSEQYRMDIPLMSDRSVAKGASPFTRNELRAFERRARECDRRGEGDEIVVVLRRR